jgi:Single Cache domain 2
MDRKLLIGGLSTTALVIATAALAQQTASGTAAEAKAMLERAVAAVKADKAKALDMFTKGEGGFKDRDLYPFCFSVADGKVLAGPPFVIGKDIRTFKDSTGKEFGKENFKGAVEGRISEVSYLFPRTNDGPPVPKVSFITGVSDLGCGVGYYP